VLAADVGKVMIDVKLIGSRAAMVSKIHCAYLDYVAYGACTKH
jgi:hypothetical protein